MLTLQTYSVVECPIGHYGKNCIHNCSKNCNLTSRCDRRTGQCEGGCITGWTGSMCNHRRFICVSCVVIAKSEVNSIIIHKAEQKSDRIACIIWF